MRSYGQYCALAKTLDVIGDRWTLLIIRELMLRGACRYTDLREGLPGVATNLLAERLRHLESAGLVSRELAPPPIASTLFELTPRGHELRQALHELGRFGIPFMVEGPEPGDEFRSRWLAWPAEVFLTDGEPTHPPIEIALHAGSEPMVLEAASGEVRVRPGEVKHPDATVSGTPHVILGLLSGELNLDAARKLGLRYEGDTAALRRVRPDTAGVR